MSIQVTPHVRPDGSTEYVLRYACSTEAAAQDLADRINRGDLCPPTAVQSVISDSLESSTQRVLQGLTAGGLDGMKAALLHVILRNAVRVSLIPACPIKPTDHI